MPDPVAFKFGLFSVHWYGLMYLLAFFLFIGLGRVRLKQPHIKAAGWTAKNVDDMLFYGVLGVIIGGRLGEVFFYSPGYFFSHPTQIFAVWNGGMSYHGGLIGVICAAWLWSRKNRRPFLSVMDFIAPLVPLGYAAGRLGNFINAELPGRPADPSLPWAMIWPNVDMVPRHPSPLYQMFFNGIVVFVIIWIYARRERPTGAVCLLYVVLSGLARFITEYFRTPDYEVSFAGFTISSGQMLSIPMVILGAIAFYVITSRAKRSGRF